MKTTTKTSTKIATILGILAASLQLGFTQNLITNGGFENYTLQPGFTEPGREGYVSTSDGWSQSGGAFLNYLFNGTNAHDQGVPFDATTLIALWGPGKGVDNGLGSSPDGGNFFGADGDADYRTSLTQTINGLNAGQDYELTFWWAGAQAYPFGGPTTESWLVTFGDQTQSTSVIDLPEHEFSGWMPQSMTFTASSSSEVLSFLAVGTPGGLPPFSLLDGVSLNSIPEPSATLLGSAAFGALLLRRRRTAESGPVG